MYTSLKKHVSSSVKGTYKKKDWSLDFERLPWIQWLNIEPMTTRQKTAFQLLYPILLQEINTKKPSKLLHYLVGKGVLFWQDVVVIQHGRQTDLERNSPLLKIIWTRGKAGFTGLVDGLRSRYGGWQGYLADMLELKYNMANTRDMMDIYKVICHDLVKVMPVGWSALPRVLGMSNSHIEKCRRENKLLANQLLHCLLISSSQHFNKDHLLSKLLSALHVINRDDIADGIAILLNTMYEIQSVHQENMASDETKETNNTALDEIDAQNEETVEVVFQQQNNGVQLKSASSFCSDGETPRADSGFDSRMSTSTPITLYPPTPPPHSSNQRYHHRSSSKKFYRKTPSLEKFEGLSNIGRVKSGRLHGYRISPRAKTNAWERRSPSILQADYLAHPNQDNLFMDYLVYQ
uniref:Uncharacterized LOC100183605 n=1 Tax=Ciona intestinalis TaxID=7719 RepID=F6VZ54_CIOIN|nr:uncharacterized protein LOC100183605 [Ciona intestinalis]|eukprot:XP_002125409.1 uncharacterized protein LOC100183605 [Ciona intestinalis]